MTKKIEVGSLTHERPKTQAEKLIATTEKPEQTRADISKKKINRKADESKTSTESRSQRKAKGSLKSKHRTMLIKPRTDDYLKAIAMIYGTSVNEVINQALDDYVAIKLQDPEIGSKIKLLQEIQIKD